MGSTDSLRSMVNDSNPQGGESSSSGILGWELLSSTSSGIIDLNIENLGLEEAKLVTPKKSVRTSSTGALTGNKKASPRNCRMNASGEKGKKDERKPKFKRKVSCTQPEGISGLASQKKRFRLSSSSQPMAAKDINVCNNPNCNVECKKQKATATKMRLRAERAEEKLELARSQLKILIDILMN